MDLVAAAPIVFATLGPMPPRGRRALCPESDRQTTPNHEVKAGEESVFITPSSDVALACVEAGDGGHRDHPSHDHHPWFTAATPTV